MKKIRIVLADDHDLVRAGFASLLKGVADVEIVAEAGDGREALRLVRLHRPELLITDVTMPGLNGLDLAERVRREMPQTRVIVLSMHGGEEHVRHALRAGASAYLLKKAAFSELEIALRAVVRGETYLSPAISHVLVSDFVRREGEAPEGAVNLPPRQREILQLIAEGKTTKEIASLLDVSVKTIETHRTRLMARLGIHDIAGLVRYAIRTGLIESEG